MPFRDSILAVSPPFLTEEGGVAEAVQISEGDALDGLTDWMIEGVEAAMPGVGTPTALYLIGTDMSLDRYPGDTDEHYALRLQRAVDSHRVHGNGPELLRQLRGFFFPSNDTPVRLVSDSAVWHEIDLITGVITKSVVGDNWTWDGFTGVRWWRGWIIIDSSVGPWQNDGAWGDPGDWGDGGTWGSTATLDEVTLIRRIVSRWKPAHMIAKYIIVCFNTTDFERPDASPPNPDGSGDDAAWRVGYDAAFWPGEV